MRNAQGAARQLGRGAVLILGDPRARPPSLPEGVAAFEYAPFAALFKRASVLVYPGGIGTTGLAMRSGLPMLVVPLAHDQPDNADRLTRLGIARTLDRRRYWAQRAAAELERLLEDPEYSRRARNLSGPSVRKTGWPPPPTPSKRCSPAMPGEIEARDDSALAPHEQNSNAWAHLDRALPIL